MATNDIGIAGLGARVHLFVDVARHQEALRRAGIREFRHRGSTHAYFSAPGGQVFRLLDVGYRGP